MPVGFPAGRPAGGGSARDSSASVLDQLIAGAGPDGCGTRNAVSLLGVTDVALLDEMCDALAAGDGATAYATIDRVAEAGHDARRFAGDLLERLGLSLIVLQQVPNAVDAKGLLDGSADELSRMELQAQRFGAATLSRMADLGARWAHRDAGNDRAPAAPRTDLCPHAASRRRRLDQRAAAAHGPGWSAGSPRPAMRRRTPLWRHTRAAACPAPVRQPRQPPRRQLQPTRTGRTTCPPAPGRRFKPAQPRAGCSSAGGGRAHRSAAGGGTAERRAAGDSRCGRRGDGTAGVWEEILWPTYAARVSARRLSYATPRSAIVGGDAADRTFRHQFHAESLARSPGLLQEAVYEVLGGKWKIRTELAGTQSGVSPGTATNAPPTSEPTAGASRSAGGQRGASGAGGSTVDPTVGPGRQTDAGGQRDRRPPTRQRPRLPRPIRPPGRARPTRPRPATGGQPANTARAANPSARGDRKVEDRRRPPTGYAAPEVTEPGAAVPTTERPVARDRDPAGARKQGRRDRRAPARAAARAEPPQGMAGRGEAAAGLGLRRPNPDRRQVGRRSNGASGPTYRRLTNRCTTPTTTFRTRPARRV